MNPCLDCPDALEFIHAGDLDQWPRTTVGALDIPAIHGLFVAWSQALAK